MGSYGGRRRGSDGDTRRRVAQHDRQGAFLTAVAFIAAGILLAVTATLRAAGAALVRTSRADALHEAADGNDRAATVAGLLENRARIQPALAPVLTGLLVFAVVPLTWALATAFSGWRLAAIVIVMAVVVVIVTDILPRTPGRSRSAWNSLGR